MALRTVKIGGVDVPFDDTPPQREGVFLWNALFSGLKTITVRWYPPEEKFGLSWDGHYGVVEHCGRNVSKLKGEFAEITYE